MQVLALSPNIFSVKSRKIRYVQCSLPHETRQIRHHMYPSHAHLAYGNLMPNVKNWYAIAVVYRMHGAIDLES
jgi:hypothetical protein